MNKMAWKGLLALTFAGATSSSAMGADADTKMRTLAEQVIVASGNDVRISAINRAYLERDKLTVALRAALPKTVSEQAVAAAVEIEIQTEAEAFFTENVRIYSTHFTEAQLRDMLTFYESAGGKALVAQTPTIIQEKAAFGRQLGKEAVARMVASACGNTSACH